MNVPNDHEDIRKCSIFKTKQQQFNNSQNISFQSYGINMKA